MHNLFYVQHLSIYQLHIFLIFFWFYLFVQYFITDMTQYENS